MATWLTTNPEELWPHRSADVIAKITRWIDQAERLLRARFPDIDSRIEQGKLDPETPADIVEAMVDRAVQRRFDRGGMSRLEYPEVKMEWDDAGGVGQGSLLYLTMDEVMQISPAASDEAFTIYSPAKPRPSW